MHTNHTLIHTIHQFLKTKPSYWRRDSDKQMSHFPATDRTAAVGSFVVASGRFLPQDFKNSYVYDCGGCCPPSFGSRNGLLFLCLTINLNRCMRAGCVKRRRAFSCMYVMPSVNIGPFIRALSNEWILNKWVRVAFFLLHLKTVPCTVGLGRFSWAVWKSLLKSRKKCWIFSMTYCGIERKRVINLCAVICGQLVAGD